MKNSAVNRGRLAESRAVVKAPYGGPSLLTDDDLHLFNEGTHHSLYEKLGAHLLIAEGKQGVCFGVWAPNAGQISVIGDFNGWNRTSHPLHPRSSSGIWEGFVPGVAEGTVYKYFIQSRHEGYVVEKADPFASHCEIPPKTGSVVRAVGYEWGDDDWMRGRGARNSLRSPMAIYEVHLGSWMRLPEEGNRSLTYRELAPKLADYAERMGFTHVELLPVMEHPFYGSWGYQITGYFAPTSRYGTPQDFMYLVDHLHQQGIGVILDWVPSHFPDDEHGLAFFDGTHLYEHEDARMRVHPDWDSYSFNYGRHEVRSFLLSSAMSWLDRYHADGLRVDAVASMLYLDYSRGEGEWVPNEFGGRESLGAIEFLRALNTGVFRRFPDVQTFAEESTAWPQVSRPVEAGGLGFGLKWDLGWMHDTLQFLGHEPVHRKHHHGEILFRMVYAFAENFLLPLSHDEVVHGKGALLEKMPGDDWQKFAQLRLLLAYMYTQPGKKLLFMGGEFGHRREWNHEESLDWYLLEQESHAGLHRCVKDLNWVYRREPALHELDCDPMGFEWLDSSDSGQGVISFLRRGTSSEDLLAVVCHFTPMMRTGYRIGVPRGGRWLEVFNSDAKEYGGSGEGNLGAVEAEPAETHGRPWSLALTVPPLSVLVFKSPGGRR